MVDGWWERVGGTYGGGRRADGARRLGCVDTGESGVWGAPCVGVGRGLAVGAVCAQGRGYALVGPRAHGGSLGRVDGVRDAWGPRVYMLVGARRVEEGGMCG